MIRIICVGKVKEKFYRDAIDEYMKRLSKYHKIVIDEVSDSNIKEEGDLILRRIQDKDYLVVLDIKGKEMDSINFSRFMDTSLMHYANITFVIGGSNGVDDRIKNCANERISFSKMTFPHQLFRIILLEQIYRGFRILSNESYHK